MRMNWVRIASTRPDQGVSHEAWKKLKDERHEKQIYSSNVTNLQEEGLILFAKYFSNLWD
jgi:hypothetical protein